MPSIVQHHYCVHKKHSLVLNSLSRHHRGMNTNTNTRKVGRIRSFIRYAWGDQVAANRALLRYPPYDDYLLNRRNGH